MNPNPDCDGCGKEIKHTNSDDQYLFLDSVYRQGSGPVTDMVWPKDIDRPHNFCRLECLSVWLKTKRPKL